jgi:hypothetical protein
MQLARVSVGMGMGVRIAEQGDLSWDCSQTALLLL